MNKIQSCCLILIISLLISGCASSRDKEDELVQNAGWQWRIFSAGKFDIAAASAPHLASDTLWVYMEGDGHAFLSPTRPSSDPTPRDPMGLRLALAHPDKKDAVVYLARPCQYTAHAYKNVCTKNFWTTDRYSPAVIENTNKVINTLEAEAGATKLVFVGYSGGGALAALVAANRNDVVRLITVAADLDIGYWTESSGLSPMTGSRNPASVAQKLGFIPQIHYTGQDDDTVEPDVAKSFMLHLPPNTPVRIIEVPDFNHHCCWAENWPKLAEDAKRQFPDKEQP